MGREEKIQLLSIVLVSFLFIVSISLLFLFVTYRFFRYHWATVARRSSLDETRCDRCNYAGATIILAYQYPHYVEALRLPLVYLVLFLLTMHQRHSVKRTSWVKLYSFVCMQRIKAKYREETKQKLKLNLNKMWERNC